MKDLRFFVATAGAYVLAILWLSDIRVNSVCFAWHIISCQLTIFNHIVADGFTFGNIKAANRR